MAKCGNCEFKGGSEEYLKHKCSTGFKPTQVEHQDALTNGRFSRQSAKALGRGEEKSSFLQKPKQTSTDKQKPNP